MHHGPELPPLSVISRTLETYDPNHHSLLIGTAALHWALGSRGIDTSSLPLRDIDVLVTEDAFEEIRSGLMKDTYAEVMPRNNRLMIRPSADAASRGVVPFDMMSDNDSYDDPTVYTKFRKRVYARDLDHAGQICEAGGVKHLDLPFVFWWKSAIGRESDAETLNRALRLLYENRAFGWGEPRSLLFARERANIGQSFAGHHIH